MPSFSAEANTDLKRKQVIQKVLNILRNIKKSLQFGWVGVGVGGSVNVDTTAKCNNVNNSDKNLF